LREVLAQAGEDFMADDLNSTALMSGAAAGRFMTPAVAIDCGLALHLGAAPKAREPRRKPPSFPSSSELSAPSGTMQIDPENLNSL
jgi:hypothetical protein